MYPVFLLQVEINDCIGVILDCDRSTLSFELNGVFLGLAFKGLPEVTLYACVSAVYGESRISMVYIGNPLVG